MIPADAPTAAADQWKVAGKSIAKVDGRAFVTGKHRYTSDLKQPGMQIGRVVRPSSFNATLVSAETSEAEGLAGVTVVRDGNFIGVAAPDARTAARAAGVIKTEWKAPTQQSSNGLFDYLRQHAGTSQQINVQGSIADGQAEANKKLNQTYTVAYIAHAPLEPRAAIAEWRDGKLTVWTGTQRPFGVRGELAEAFRIPAERVRVIVPDTGSAYAASTPATGGRSCTAGKGRRQSGQACVDS